MLVSLIHRFITSLVFTITVETIVLYLILRFVLKNQGLSPKKIISAGFFASFSTIPYVWFVFPSLLPVPKNTIILYSELFAFILETIFYRIFLKTNLKTSFMLSLLCNSTSYFLGPILRSFGFWIYW